MPYKFYRKELRSDYKANNICYQHLLEAGIITENNTYRLAVSLYVLLSNMVQSDLGKNL